MRVASLSLILAAGLILAGCTTPGEENELTGVKGGSGSGGGRVTDEPAVFQAFSGDLVNADNSGTSAEVFSMTLFDANGEKDFKSKELVIDITGPAASTFSRVIAASESNTPSAEPATFDAAGWKVWSDVKDDGILYAEFRYVYPLGTTAGTYSISASLFESGGLEAETPAEATSATSDQTTVAVFSEITVDPTPVDANGDPVAGAGVNWGEWVAAPGASNVESTNYLKLTNTGQDADAAVVIDYSAASFTGVDANFTIPLDGNVAFAWFEDTSPGSSAPREGTFTYGAASGDGSVTVRFSGLGNIIYVTYQVIELPDVLAAQSYGAPFTATEL